MKRRPVSAIELGSRRIGGGEPCFVIGEVGLAHDGSLGFAHAFIDAIAAAGAHAVKFQVHIAGAEGTAGERFRVTLSGQDVTRAEFWNRTGFTQPQWQGLLRHAHEKGLVFISSPFSIEAVEMLAGLGADGLKIASGEVGNLPMLEAAAGTGLPVLVSSGMSPLAELDAAVECLRGAPVGVFQCTTAYPCPPEKVGLNVITELAERYGLPTGLSDHSGTVFPALAAAALGVDMIEVHVTLSREMYGPDVSASVTTSELRTLTEGVRFIETTLAHPVDKDAIVAEFGELRDIFTKSIVAARNLDAGRVLSSGDLTTKKPGTGIPAARLDEVIGRRLLRPLKADDLILEDDVE